MVRRNPRGGVSSDVCSRAVAVIEFGGRAFDVTSVANVRDDEECFEFTSTGPGGYPAPNVAIARKDHAPSTLYVSVDGEIEVDVLEEIISYAEDGFGVE